MGVEKQCVVAYSGGLDTSAIVPWLIERGYVVHAVLVDVGQDEDLPELSDKALRYGARTAVIRDAQPAMFAHVIPPAIGLAATYEGAYRLGTALARPFIAMEQVRRARELGGATLVHGATGKGNDQVRFEFAYRSLAPDYPVLAPWKVWEFAGRADLVNYLLSKGLDGDFEITKDYSLDENLWHLSVEGGMLEDPTGRLDIARVLAAVADRFACQGGAATPRGCVQVDFQSGVPVGLGGSPLKLPALIGGLNRDYRHASWAWDLVIENRFTGIKSRGLYINPAAKLLHMAADALARCCLNKPSYDQYADLGRQYAAALYQGEYFSDQRVVLDAAARSIMAPLSGAVTVQLEPTPYVSHIESAAGMFREELATFEKSDYAHQDAQGFIRLSWLSRVGRPMTERVYANSVEEGSKPTPEVRADQPVPARGLVSSSA
ncbi:MAG: argininosuccinate synthase [Phycisphaerae bacterium]